VRERVVPVPHGGCALVAHQLDADQKGIRRTDGAHLGGFGSVSRNRNRVRRRHGRRRTFSSKRKHAANALFAIATATAVTASPTRVVLAAADGDGLLQRSLAYTVMVLRHCEPRHCVVVVDAAVAVDVIVAILLIIVSPMTTFSTPNTNIIIINHEYWNQLVVVCQTQRPFGLKVD